MNRYAMLHIVDSSYCFPVSEKEIVLRLRTARDDIQKAEVIFESKYVIGTSQRRREMPKAYSSELYDYFEINNCLINTCDFSKSNLQGIDISDSEIKFSIFTNVDLPHPVWPIINTNSPF